MAWFDVTTPTDNDLEGDGNTVIKAIKTELNKLDGKVFSQSSDPVNFPCVTGWPRIWTIASISSPPANPGTGQLAFCFDTLALWCYTGSTWQRVVGAIQERSNIPLYYGPGQRFTNAAYGSVISPLLYVISNGTWVGDTWGASSGPVINMANIPAAATVKFVITAAAYQIGQAKIKLRDAVAGDISGGEITIQQTYVAEFSSGDLRATLAALGAGDRTMQMVGMGGTSAYFDLIAAELRIQV